MSESRRWKVTLNGTLGWVLFPILAVVFLVFSLQDLPGDLRARHGEGVVGSFTALREDCTTLRYGTKICTWNGNFVSDSGDLRLTDVELLDDVAEEVGQVIPAVAEGEAIYSADHSTAWKFTVKMLVFWGIGLLIWIGCLWYVLAKGRRPLQAEGE